MIPSKLKNKFLTAIILGAVVFLGLAVYGDWKDILECADYFQWSMLIPVLFLAFMNYIVRFFKWHYYIRLLNIGIPKMVSLKIFFSGLIMSISPGKFGEVLKSYLLKKSDGTPISVSAPVVAAERFTDFISLLILAMFGVVSFRYGAPVFILGISIVVFILVCVGNRRLASVIVKLMRKVPLIDRFGDRLETAYESMYLMVRPAPLTIATAVSVLAWFCECLGFYLVLVGLNITDISLYQATFIYSISTIAGALTMLPGGIGLTEIGMTGLLRQYGAAKSPAASATIIIRICTLWFAVLVGIAALSIYQRNLRKSGKDLKDYGNLDKNNEL